MSDIAILLIIALIIPVLIHFIFFVFCKISELENDINELENDIFYLKICLIGKDIEDDKDEH